MHFLILLSYRCALTGKSKNQICNLLIACEKGENLTCAKKHTKKLTLYAVKSLLYMGHYFSSTTLNKLQWCILGNQQYLWGADFGGTVKPQVFKSTNEF